MKRIIPIILIPLLMWACSKENASPADADMAPYTRDAVVTAMQEEDGTVYLLMQGLKLLPYEDIGYAGPGRAMCSLTIYAEQMADQVRRAQVHWIEWLDRGEVLPGAGQTVSDGVDPILDSWITSVEDGYLTLHYNAWWGDTAKRHDLKLLTGGDPEDPYLVRLIHDAHGDTGETYTDGIVYFDLNALPPTGEETVRLTLNWTNTNGQEASAGFDFRTRK